MMVALALGTFVHPLNVLLPRMVLLDISATGEENLIEQQSGNPMNDLEYRRKQLLKLQDAVIDLEDLSTGVSIADMELLLIELNAAFGGGLASSFAQQHLVNGACP